MKKLIQGIVEFRKNLTEESQALFAKLALGQKPDVLFIACSNSKSQVTRHCGEVCLRSLLLPLLISIPGRVESALPFQKPIG